MFHIRVLSDSEVNPSARRTLYIYIYFLVYRINHIAKEQATDVVKVWDFESHLKKT